jgi:hypothetical protein
MVYVFAFMVATALMLASSAGPLDDILSGS